MFGKIKEKICNAKLIGVLTDIVLMGVFIAAGLYAYDQYKLKTQRVYVVDVQKIFQLKQSSFTLSKATESDVMKYYDGLEEMVKYSNAFINQVSKDKKTLVYSKNYVLTADDGRMIDLTDELIGKLRQQKLLP